MQAVIASIFVFVGCCSNVVFLELITREQPSAGNLITFAQFVFVASIGFIFTTKCSTKKSVIPIKTYAVMVAIFFIVSTSNNYALGFDIPMPLHIIFRSGSLIANLILGVIELKHRYSLFKYISVMMVTAGIVTATYASAVDMHNRSAVQENEDITLAEFSQITIGIALLVFALFMSAQMGIFQETVYKKYGKHPGEALFYNHALPLPGFLLFASDIATQARSFTSSEAVLIPLISVPMPKLWLYLLGNVITQYVCIKSVFILTTECTSLTVTLVVTLRKFASLIFSIVYFSNPFTPTHWLGTILVFIGTLMFTGTLDSLLARITQVPDGEKKRQ